jgi:hypothetical protein
VTGAAGAPRAEDSKPQRQSKAYHRAAAFLAGLELDDAPEVPKPATAKES